MRDVPMMIAPFGSRDWTWFFYCCQKMLTREVTWCEKQKSDLFTDRFFISHRYE